MALDETFYVFLALVVFLALLWFYGVFKKAGAALDERAARITKELDDARKLREDAQATLASYQRKQRDAEKEAESIIAAAKADADRYAKEARAALEEQVARRTQQAEDKIARAEADAISEVKAAAASVAVTAARNIIAAKVDAARDAKLVDDMLGTLPSKLN